MKYVVVSLLLVTLPSILEAAQQVSSSASPWLASEKDELFVPFPKEVQQRLDNELELYKTTKNKDMVPEVRVFQKYPENPKHRIWPQMKSITKRLYPILWPKVHYYVEDGLKFGCRQPNPNSTIKSDTLPVTSTRCHRHCLHQGRYCIREPNLPPDHRRPALKEILRRLCMDNIYHAKDPRYISYLEHFDDLGCGGHPHTSSGREKPTGGFRNCSHAAMNLAGMKYSDISSCIAEDKFEKDVPSDVMNRNLRQFAKHPRFNNATAAMMPQVTFNNNRLSKSKPLTSKTIFQKYCSLFPTVVEQPLACHACKDCSNVRECLWTLKCDGKDFDPSKLKPGVLSLTVPSHSGGDKATTEAPGGDVGKVKTDEWGDVVGYHQDALAHGSQSGNTTSSSGSGPALEIIGMIAVVGFGLFAFVFHYQHGQRKQRANKQLTELASGKSYSDGLYRDNPSNDNDPQHQHDQTIYTDHPFEKREEKLEEDPQVVETVEWVDGSNRFVC